MDRRQPSISTPRLSSINALVSSSPTASRVSVDAPSQSHQRSSNGNLAGEGVPLPLDKRVNRSSKDSLSVALEKVPPLDEALPKGKDEEVCISFGHGYHVTY